MTDTTLTRKLISDEYDKVLNGTDDGKLVGIFTLYDQGTITVSNADVKSQLSSLEADNNSDKGLTAERIQGFFQLANKKEPELLNSYFKTVDPSNTDLDGTRKKWIKNAVDITIPAYAAGNSSGVGDAFSKLGDSLPGIGTSVAAQGQKALGSLDGWLKNHDIVETAKEHPWWSLLMGLGIFAGVSSLGDIWNGKGMGKIAGIGTAAALAGIMYMVANFGPQDNPTPERVATRGTSPTQVASADQGQGQTQTVTR